MKAVVITQPGEPDVLGLEDRPIPNIVKGDVLVEVKAAGVNRPDIMQRQGLYPAPKGAPSDIPGLEVSGIITKIGDGVSRWKVGDPVCALVAGGGYAEFVSVSSKQCLPIPKGLSFVEAASLPETFFTVWTNVFDRVSFQSGDNVLIHGGTSGIGVTAIQMVKAFGGKAYTTAGTKDKCDFAEQIGAFRAINYKEEDFEEVIKSEANGIDVVLDMVGGDYTAKNINVLNVDGRLVIINAMKGRLGEVDLMKVMVKRLTITGSTLRPRNENFKYQIAQNLEEKVWPYLESKEIKPIIYKVFGLANAVEAHTLMESSSHIGKIVLEVTK